MGRSVREVLQKFFAFLLFILLFLFIFVLTPV
jgi:hypothetical protein